MKTNKQGMRLLDKILTIFFIIVLVVLESALVCWCIYIYNIMAQIKQSVLNAPATAGNPNVADLIDMNMAWRQLAMGSLFILLPLIFAIIHLRHPGKLWMTILFYVIFTLYFAVMGLYAYFIIMIFGS
jgi:formate-dependent nitrite reductase membrane component NrfD